MAEKRDCLQRIIRRITLQTEAITIEIDRAGLAKAVDIENAPIPTDGIRTETIRLPMQLRRRGVEARLVLTDGQRPSTNADPNLVRLIGQAHSCFDKLSSGECKSISELAGATGSNAAEISRNLPLAFLAPEIVRVIVDGRQPVELAAESLKRLDHLPIVWKDQRRESNKPRSTTRHAHVKGDLV